MNILSEEPPKLSKKDGHDSSVIEFVSLCLNKDPLKRVKAEDLLNNCKNFFSKAKGQSY